MERPIAAGPSCSGRPCAEPLVSQARGVPAHAEGRRASRRQQLSTKAVLAPAENVDQAGQTDIWAKAQVITAIKTPYRTGGRIDIDAYDQAVEQQIRNGVDGVIVGGTTGEGQLLSWDEHVMLVAHTARAFGDDVLVVGNTGSNSTREALHATEQGFAVGMHAALQINPYYGKTSMAGLLTHFKAVLAEGPAIVYNVPGRTGQDIPDHVIEELAAGQNFLGVKECTGNQRIRTYTAKGIRCWSGNDDEAFEARHRAGATGAISVASNLIPGLYARMMKEDQPELAASAAALMDWLFCEPNPIPLNTALAMCGLIRPVFRLPYVPLDRQRREDGAKLLRALLPDLPGVSEINPLEDSDFELVSRP